ncbi:MAG: SAM-dependent methyltransferase [Candidatus Heimdallarchaeota archaeon]|nr:SAM-dependent methyltransferase [Candidatus Heimdallarchaeota archaeon]MCK4252968.1 SAM-dependent methyltransferase [Candidatus Heimdallarchaeota archaeon]
MLDREELFEFLIQEYEHPFSGWDFSHIRDRMVSSPLPWSYASKILPKLIGVDSLLDMGTGGGEFLANNFQPFPKNTCATEAFGPNVPLAKKRLEPLGVKVVKICGDGSLPFKNKEFELIINQHEYYDATEVFRILKKGGEFITKQVDGSNDKELADLLGATCTADEWTLKSASKELERAGFNITEKLAGVQLARFFDIGAVVFFLKIVPWAISDFSIEKYKDKLFALHEKIFAEGYIEVKNPRFMIVAKKE